MSSRKAEFLMASVAFAWGSSYLLMKIGLKVEEFAYVDYNHVRPHSYNGYRTPYEARTAA